MSEEPNGNLAEAIRQYRAADIRSEALFEAENKILNRMPARARRPQPLYWLAGATAAACGIGIMLVPSKSFAAEIRQIASNADASVRHVRTYGVQSDGSLQLAHEEYSDGTHTRWIDMFGTQYAYDQKRVTVLHTDGCATVESQMPGTREETRASSLVMQFTSDSNVRNVKSKVDKGLSWNSQTVDRYTVDESYLDPQGHPWPAHMDLYADPATERPIEIHCKIEGLCNTVAKWDYPANNPALFKLPITEKTKIFDIDAEHQTIVDGLIERGQSVKVGGKTVELGQLWVDEQGSACVIAKADYAYPDNYGPHVDGKNVSELPEEEPFSGRYYVHEAYQYSGRPVQFFLAARMPNSKPTAFGEVANVEVPVFAGHTLQGYAKFENVPVHRAWNLYFMLRPDNRPFWMNTEPKRK